LAASTASRSSENLASDDFIRGYARFMSGQQKKSRCRWNSRYRRVGAYALLSGANGTNHA
jgi:hypothetical protein